MSRSSTIYICRSVVPIRKRSACQFRKSPRGSLIDLIPKWEAEVRSLANLRRSLSHIYATPIFASFQRAVITNGCSLMNNPSSINNERYERALRRISQHFQILKTTLRFFRCDFRRVSLSGWDFRLQIIGRETYMLFLSFPDKTINRASFILN